MSGSAGAAVLWPRKIRSRPTAGASERGGCRCAGRRRIGARAPQTGAPPYISAFVATNKILAFALLYEYYHLGLFGMFQLNREPHLIDPTVSCDRQVSDRAFIGRIFRASFLTFMVGLAHSTTAGAQTTLAATIWKHYQATPTLPFTAFKYDSAEIPLPGATISNLSQRMIDGVLTYDPTGAVICSAQKFDYPKLRGTQGLRQTFSADNRTNKFELKLLLDLNEDALSAVRSYEVILHSVHYATIPYNQLLAVKAETSKDKKCTSLLAPTKTVSKPIIANVDIVLRLGRDFSSETLTQISRHSTIEVMNGVQSLKISMPQRLIALGVME